jgi:hypothetical protein
MSDDEKEESMKSFLKTVNESDVEVFCIMDYWTFDWCKELIKYKKANPDALDKTVFHGIELRIECSVDYRLNIHVILSDNTTEQELDDFKSALQIRIGEDNRNLSNEALKQFAKALSDDKAKKHGYNPPNELSGIELLELGSKTAEVSRDSLKEALRKSPRGVDSLFYLMIHLMDC